MRHENSEKKFKYAVVVKELESTFEVDAVYEKQASPTNVITHSSNGRANPRSRSSVARTILSLSPMIDDPSYIKSVQIERYIIIAILVELLIVSPLVFRYTMGSRSSYDDDGPIIWGHDIDIFEKFFLSVMFLVLTGTILRILPVLCGRPATLESSQKCTLEGKASLCTVSPFCSEDDQILLRSLIGRSCTMFSTVAGRHKLCGIYVDAILNERRLKGEKNRKNLWLEWMIFITALMKISQKSENANASTGHQQPRANVIKESSNDKVDKTLPTFQVDKFTSDEEVTLGKVDTHTASRYRSRPVTFSGKNKFQALEDFGNAVATTTRMSIIEGRNSLFNPELINATQNNTMDLEMEFADIPVTANGHSTRASTCIMSTFVPSNDTDEDSIGTPYLEEAPTSPVKNPMVSLSQNPNNDDFKRATSKFGGALDVEVVAIQPVIDFLHAWLKEMKENEWSYDYLDKKDESLDKLFLAAPFMQYFNGDAMLQVYAALLRLYRAFKNKVPDDKDPKSPVYQDDIVETEWNLRREDGLEWQVVWTLISRARLRELTRETIKDTTGPAALYDCTEIIPGAIVYLQNRFIGDKFQSVRELLVRRRYTYKVVSVNNDTKGKTVSLIVFPPSDLNEKRMKAITVAFESVTLIEMNRGKAGALNFCNSYLRAKTNSWRNILNDPDATQTFVGIVDARHALVEPNIFWNDALPFFSIEKDSGRPVRKYGFGNAHDYPVCITVQYPQYFSNVGTDDYLDNANTAYYNMWQPLRDCAKCITSSGTNTVWDISSPHFLFCTTSRSEDLGTSHEYIPQSAAIYLSSYVAYGIAKKTEDYLEALYRWAAGPLELFWPSLFDLTILSHYLTIGIPVIILGFASFSESGWWYIAHLLTVAVYCVMGLIDKLNGKKPFRSIVVSSVITTNLWGWAGSGMSVAWIFILPLRIGLFGAIPFSFGDRSAIWPFITVALGVPSAILNDSIIRMVKKTYPNNKVDYYKAMWRGSQLYAVSCAYSVMAVLAGTYSAYKAYRYKRDLSLWSSFRVGASEIDKAWDNVRQANSLGTFVCGLGGYILVILKSFIASFTIPTTMTRYYVTFLFCAQVLFLIISTTYTNANSYINEVVLLASCFVNLCLIYPATFLLQPDLRYLVGFPVRLELLYGYLGVAMVVLYIVYRQIPPNDLWNHLQLTGHHNN